MQNNLSAIAYADASKYIPGGVNSPVRALRSLGAEPLFASDAKGAYWNDLDGNRYIDFCLSWGVFILGHQHPATTKAAIAAIRRGSSFGIPSIYETDLARMVVASVQSIEQVRFVSSGTEAVMSAIRLARAYTGRNIIVKFDGCYHGHVDHMLVAAGSGVAGLSTASSAGVPESFTNLTISLPFNDVESVKQIFALRGSEIAAVILEPVPANMGVIVPDTDFLHTLRSLTSEYHSLLIFDEVITGFRLGMGGAQQMLGVIPDLTTIGKIVGGGYPAAAFGGHKEIMQMLAPIGPVYQAGTLSGNPVAMAAGAAVLKEMSEKRVHESIGNKTAFFIGELKEIIRDKELWLNQVGSMFTLFFSRREIRNFKDVQESDLQGFSNFWRQMAARGVYLSPSAFEASFISEAHSYRMLETTLKNIKQVINQKKLKI